VLEHLPRPRPSLDDDTAAANAPDNVHLSDAPSGRPSRIGRHLPARLGGTAAVPTATAAPRMAWPECVRFTR
jgi:hypothetical protein